MEGCFYDCFRTGFVRPEMAVRSLDPGMRHRLRFRRSGTGSVRAGRCRGCAGSGRYGCTATQESDIIVTGFRQSLGAAINLKRQSVSSVDAIVAEDIAKFPDQISPNPCSASGISIQRDGGEERAITVHGLGGAVHPRARQRAGNGATSTDGASSNRDRSFGYNVFASELFSSLVVHKTAEASLDEARSAPWSISTPATRLVARKG